MVDPHAVQLADSPLDRGVEDVLAGETFVLRFSVQLEGPLGRQGDHRGEFDTNSSLEFPGRLGGQLAGESVHGVQDREKRPAEKAPAEESEELTGGNVQKLQKSVQSPC